MTGAPARVAEYAPKDGSLAGLLEHNRVVRAVGHRASGAEVISRLEAMRSQITRTAEDLFRISMVAQTRAQEALERHDANAEGAIREVTAAATEARDVVIKLRNDIRQSGTDPDAHPTDELVRATTALTIAEQHVATTESMLEASRIGLESVWTAAARQCVQDGVMLFGAVGEEVICLLEDQRAWIGYPLPQNVTRQPSLYPLPVYELREVLHGEKPAQRYEAGATS